MPKRIQNRYNILSRSPHAAVWVIEIGVVMIALSYQCGVTAGGDGCVHLNSEFEVEELVSLVQNEVPHAIQLQLALLQHQFQPQRRRQ